MERPFECDHCLERFTTASYLQQHMASHVEQTLHTSGPESVGPQQWVVVKGQCVHIKQEKKVDTSNLSIKQENQDMSNVVKEQCVPIKREKKDDTSNLSIKQENQDMSNVVKEQCGPIKREKKVDASNFSTK